MSREIRKANLRRLQLPGTVSSNRNLRKSRSATATVTTTISSYFSASPDAQVPSQPDEQSDSLPSQQPNSIKQISAEKDTAAATGALKPSISDTTRYAKRTKLTAFVFKDNKLTSDDFETPQKKIKKAPNLRRSNATKTGKSQASKRQPSVKSAFLRNELLFSEITAQHSVAEQFNPDEVQLALAISKSEAESSGGLSVAAAEKDVVVDLVHGEKYRTNEDVRNKLQMYGFRTATREDYNCLAAAFLPGANRRNKFKWASKFTALTLRNPEVQRRKVNARIDDFLKQQLRTSSSSASKNSIDTYTFISNTLRQCKEQQEAAHVLKREDGALLTLPLAGYFVQELFEVAHLPAGHLLKDWSAIPGRDLSPKPQCKQRRTNEAKLRAVYAELEGHFGGVKKDALKTDSSVAAWESNVELEKLVELIAELPQSPPNRSAVSGNETVDSHLNIKVETALAGSPSKGPPEKKIKTPSNSRIEFSDSSTLNSVLQPSTRVTSPDIFADSDKEMDDIADASTSATVEQDVVMNNSVLSQHGIAVYESYCTEGVKISFNKEQCDAVKNQGIHINAQPAGQVVDLTQDEEDTSEVRLSSQFSATPDRADTIADHNSLRVEDANNIQMDSATRSLSQDAEIVAAMRDFGREEYTVANSKSLNRCEVSDEQFRRLLEKYMEPNKQINCSVPVQLNETPAKNTVRKRLSKECSWNCTTQALQTTLMTSDADQLDTVVQHATEADISIDLTQSDVSDSTDNCIVLSDDEINYSIWRADKSTNIGISERKSLQTAKLGCSSSAAEVEKSDANDFSILDLIYKDEFHSLPIEANQGHIKQQLSPSASVTSLFHATCKSGDPEPIAGEYLTTRQSSNDCMNMSETQKTHDRSRVLAEFGIMENFSESFTQTALLLQTPSKSSTDRFGYSENDGSFLGSPSENAAFMRRCRSGASQKLSTLLQESPTSTNNAHDMAVSVANDDVFDEFDKLIYGSPKRTPTTNHQKVPDGLEQLLTAEISFRNERLTEIEESGEKCQKVATLSRPFRHEYEIDGRKYNACVVVAPKPDFVHQTEAELLKQLYAFGIKPLKRKQAIKMLEYIYNQTHPLMLEEATKESLEVEVASLPTMEGSWKKSSEFDYNFERSQVKNQNENLSGSQISTSGKAAIQIELQLKDCGGDVLLRFAQELSIEREDEQYIFQTNITKKLSQALLPLHVAWYNLVCSSSTLHEMILLFEPIDLQQIYLFFKQLGFRYEPKDLKGFFDNRCIIFRYDLTLPGKQVERHTRKPTRSKKLIVQKPQKCR